MLAATRTMAAAAALLAKRQAGSANILTSKYAARVALKRGLTSKVPSTTAMNSTAMMQTKPRVRSYSSESTAQAGKIASNGEDMFCAWVFVGWLVGANVFVVWTEIHDPDNGYWRNLATMRSKQHQARQQQQQQQLEASAPSKEIISVAPLLAARDSREIMSFHLKPTRTVRIQWLNSKE